MSESPSAEPTRSLPVTALSPSPLHNSLPRHERLARLVLWLGVGLVGGYHLAIHLASLRFTLPMGSWETVYAAVARAWPNQYQWSHYVDGHDGYGPGYPTFVQPFLRAGLDVYVAHRLANLLTLGLACGLVAWLLRKAGTAIHTTAAAVTVFYALNAGSYSIQARPDFLVLLEITALLALGEAAVRGTVKLGWRFGVVFGALTLAAFFTKAYAVFTWGTVLAFLAVFVDWRRALVTAGVSGAILGGGVAAFAARNPLYVFEVFRGPAVQAEPSLAWLRNQTADFALLACGLVGASLLPLALRAWHRRPGVPSETGPLPATDARLVGYWRWQAALAALALLGGPGWHTGAYLTYFLHLLLVPLVMLAGIHSMRVNAPVRTWLDLALVANLAVLITLTPAWPQSDPDWARLRRDILGESGRVAVDYLMEPIAREKGGSMVVSTGQTGYTLREPFLMTENLAVITEARAAATAFIRQQVDELFGDRPADVIYLDCVVMNAPDGSPGRFAAIPRNDLPYFRGPEMNRYAPTRAYQIRPYYFATNAPRQKAGVVTTTIVRFERKR